MGVIKNQQQYLKLLEEYWDSIEAAQLHYPNKRVEYIAKEIRDFKENIIINIKIKIVVAALVSFASSVLIACVLIWSINEVMQIPVPFNFKNVLIVSSLFFVSKMKLKILELN